VHLDELAACFNDVVLGKHWLGPSNRYSTAELRQNISAVWRCGVESSNLM
jgi:hypothetical protein